MLSVWLQVNADTGHRIDWVGEPGHRQPQDPPPKYETNKIRNIHDVPYEHGPPYKHYDQNEIPINDDLQQVQKPVFERDVQGTYLEFLHQRTEKPKVN